VEGIRLIRPEETGLIKKVLFERPISRLQARKIGLLAGRHAQLKKINDVHNIVSILNHHISIIAESELRAANVPAEIFLETTNKQLLLYSNSDEAISKLDGCNYCVIGMDIEISSRLQLFLEKLINSRTAPIFFTDESINLFKISPDLVLNRQNDTYVCSTKKLTELANFLSISIDFNPKAGIFNKIELIRRLAEYLRANIICIESYQILGCSYTSKEKIIVVNLKNNNNKNVEYFYIPILACLLSDVPNPDKDIVDRMLTAGYLLRNSIYNDENVTSGLKKVLLEYK
jgi:hypothetical protein